MKQKLIKLRDKTCIALFPNDGTSTLIVLVGTTPARPYTYDEVATAIANSGLDDVYLL